MFKLLFLGMLVYICYRFMSKPARIHSGQSQEKSNLDSNLDEKDDDYIDYEEVK